ncbi:valine--tRNA ligase [bacterium]|nr:valine--tRNA ligase [bacterium]
MLQFEKSYRPGETEEKWYRAWEESGAFTARERGDGETFSIVIPPPNVTGILHIGHALNTTLQDILARWRRMQGRDTLWVPGTDHAGIATQNVVEKQLAEEGKDRHQVGRERFLERVWEWRERSGGTIISQLKRLGCSCDWSRERFTLDEGLSRAVQQVFIGLHREGLIYRDERIINWCPRCHTALSDLEVDYQDQPGHLHHVRYPFVEGEGGLVVATTRPETIPGDTAVAVHPEDERYRGAVGKKIRLPVDPFREIPVVADGEVDPSFGTGALKITPAHDAADFEIGRRHGVAAVRVIDKEGVLTAGAGRYAGLDRFEGRERILEDLREGGCLEDSEDYTVPLGHCYRCKKAVEPALSPQWFVKVKPLAAPAIEAVRDKRTRIIPEHWERTYFDWMENIRDWCISRQIWWGHQIPAWYCVSCDGKFLQRDTVQGRGRAEAEVLSINIGAVPIVSEERPESCAQCGGADLVQDPDVLDTWFSSALWPFSTLGWPDQTGLLETYYPTSVLVTSFDILFFWVARMMMMGMKFMGEIPFRDVYIHALVRDAEGQKMSKSKGNVIDPIGMMEAYGTDAFRFTLTAMAAQGRDIKLSEERIAGYRNFVTKLWNATRLLSLHLDPEMKVEDPSPHALEDRWILSRLNEVVGRTNEALESYHFNEAAATLYQFAWHEFCDWYLEIVKPRLAEEDEEGRAARQVSLFVLLRLLGLLHPIMPFVTEEIASRLPGRRGMLVRGPYPAPEGRWRDRDAEERVGFLMEVVNTVRTIRGEMNIRPGQEVDIIIRNLPEEKESFLRETAPVVARLARAGKIEIGAVEPPKESAASPLSAGELFIPLAGIVDFRSEVKRLEKEIGRMEKEIGRYEKKLSRRDFLERAPKHVVEKDRRVLAESVEKREYLDRSRKRMLSWLGQ